MAYQRRGHLSWVVLQLRKMSRRAFQAVSIDYGMVQSPSFLSKEEYKPLFPEGKPYLQVSVKHQRRKAPSELKAAELKSAVKQISN